MGISFVLQTKYWRYWKFKQMMLPEENFRHHQSDYNSSWAAGECPNSVPIHLVDAQIFHKISKNMASEGKSGKPQKSFSLILLGLWIFVPESFQRYSLHQPTDTALPRATSITKKWASSWLTVWLANWWSDWHQSDWLMDSLTLDWMAN